MPKKSITYFFYFYMPKYAKADCAIAWRLTINGSIMPAKKVHANYVHVVVDKFSFTKSNIFEKDA